MKHNKTTHHHNHHHHITTVDPIVNPDGPAGAAGPGPGPTHNKSDQIQII